MNTTPNEFHPTTYFGSILEAKSNFLLTVNLFRILECNLKEHH